MHGYEQGRLDLPFVGHCTFGKRPPCLDWDALDAEVAVLGVPYDMGTQYRAGARFGPRAIREASTLFSFGHGGAYDHEDDVGLPGARRGADRGCGRRRHRPHRHRGEPSQRRGGGAPDPRARRHAGRARRRPRGQHPLHPRLRRRAADPSRADRRPSRFRRRAPRRARGPRQSDAPRRRAGARQRADPARHPQRLLDRARGLRGRQAARLHDPLGAPVPPARPRGRPGADPGRASATTSPSTSTPSTPRSRPAPGRRATAASSTGRSLEFLQGLAARGEVVGIDLVEVAPAYDPSGITAILAAQLLLNFLGFIFHERSKGRPASG